MMAIVAPAARERGYAPDFSITPDATHGGKGRPWPYMVFRNLEALGVSSVQAAAKVGDTASDMREGKAAGGVHHRRDRGAAPSWGLQEEYEALSPAERDRRARPGGGPLPRSRGRRRGAHPGRAPAAAPGRSVSAGRSPRQLPADRTLAHAHEIGVETSFGHERIVRAALHDAPAVEHDDLVGIAHGLQAMRDHDDRLAARQLGDGALQVALVLRVDVGGGPVEDDDGRVLQDGARDGEALALAARQRGPPSPRRGVALRAAPPRTRGSTRARPPPPLRAWRRAGRT